jgi:4-amino-4-deoxy-L-arabinose transferase-like glycosyltransferase
VLWLRVAQAVLTTAGVALTFFVGERLVGRRAAIAAAGVYSLDPLTAVSAALLYPEASAALFLAAAALAAVEAARRDSMALSAVAGGLLGILALSRPAALAVLPVAAAWTAYAAPSTPLRRAGHAAVVVLVCVLMLAPWTYRNYQLQGQIIVVSNVGTRSTKEHGAAGALVVGASRKPLAFARGVGEEFAYFWELFPHRLKTDDPEARQALHRDNPRLPTAPLAPRSLRDVVAATASGIELLLAVLGLVVLWRSRRREAVLLAGMILVFALGHSLFVGRMRYRITVLPLVFVLAGVGFATLQAALAGRLGRTRLDPATR